MLAGRRAMDFDFARRYAGIFDGAIAVREGTDRRRRRLPAGQQERVDAEARGGTNALSCTIPAGEETLRSGRFRRDSLTHGLAPLHILPSRIARRCGWEADLSETRGDAMIRRLMMALVLACLWSSTALMAAPIHDAARQGDEHRVSELLAAGADVNAKDEDGRTPLHWAAGSGQAGAVKALLAAGADVNAKGNEGLTPLHAAAVMGRAGVVNALLGAGADMNAKLEDGWTPLHTAAYSGGPGAVEVLLAAGAKVNAKGNEGETPLHSAARGGQAGVVTTLLAAGADVNAKGNEGVTPLHLAAGNGQAGAVTALLAAGAKVNARAGGKLTPLDAARHWMEETEESVKPFQEVIRTLKAHGARERRGR